MNEETIADLTLRDYFAAHAISQVNQQRPSGVFNWIRMVLGMDYVAYNTDARQNAREAYKIADEMIKIRKI